MSLRGAINAKCRDCIHDPLSGLGNWRQQVGGCTVTRCGLWNVRPRSSAGPNRAIPEPNATDPLPRHGSAAEPATAAPPGASEAA